MGSLGGNTVYHMGTLSRASKNRDMARESEKQQQVTIKSFEARETKIIKSIKNQWSSKSNHLRWSTLPMEQLEV